MSGSGTDDCHTLRYALELDDETWTPVQKLRRVMDDAHHMLVQGRKGLFFNLPHDALLAMIRHPLLAQLDCVDPSQNTGQRTDVTRLITCDIVFTRTAAHSVTRCGGVHTYAGTSPASHAGAEREHRGARHDGAAPRWACAPEHASSSVPARRAPHDSGAPCVCVCVCVCVLCLCVCTHTHMTDSA